MRRIVVIILCLLTLSSVAAERRDSSVIHRVGLNLRPGILLQNHDFFKGSNATGRPMLATGSVHLQYSFMFPASSNVGRIYPTSYQGIGVAAYTFGNHAETGTPTALYVFQGGEIARFGKSLSLDYEWNFGLSMGWKPYDDVLNPNNLVVGTAVNAFINVGMMLSWHPKKDLAFSAGLDFSHFSNGDTTFPNSGVNSVTARFGVVKSFTGGCHDIGRNHYGRKKPTIWFVDRIRCDVIAYGAWNEESVRYQEEEHYVDGKFAVAGLNINPLCLVCFPWLSVGPSLDIQYNEGMNIQSHVAGVTPGDGSIKFYRPSFREQFAVGLSLRAEIQMPIFAVNLGVGHNVIYKGEELDGLYYFAALKTFLTKSLFAHVGLKVTDSDCSNNLMLGVGWRFGNKY